MGEARKSDLVDLDMEIHAETEKAFKLSDDGERSSAKWVAKSQIEVERKAGTRTAKVTMPEWLAVENGWV